MRKKEFQFEGGAMTESITRRSIDDCDDCDAPPRINRRINFGKTENCARVGFALVGKQGEGGENEANEHCLGVGARVGGG